MKIGMFGGCFNPPTIAHFKLAKEAIKKFNLDKVFFVPVGNKYNKKDLIDEKHRYNMLKIMCEKDKNLDVSDIEMNREYKLYAIDVFTMLTNKYKNDELYFIMGADNVKELDTWKESNLLMQNFKFIILERGDESVEDIIIENKNLQKYRAKFNILKNQEIIDCSSTKVREKIEKHEIVNLVKQEVYKYIINNNLYL